MFFLILLIKRDLILTANKINQNNLKNAYININV